MNPLRGLPMTWEEPHPNNCFWTLYSVTLKNPIMIYKMHFTICNYFPLLNFTLKQCSGNTTFPHGSTWRVIKAVPNITCSKTMVRTLLHSPQILFIISYSYQVIFLSLKYWLLKEQNISSNHLWRGWYDIDYIPHILYLFELERDNVKRVCRKLTKEFSY